MEARELILSAGGIGQFLSKSLQFFHMDGYVSLMVDVRKVQALAKTSKEKGVDGQTKKPKTRALPPDTRSRDQFPTLGATAPEDGVSNYHKNHGTFAQNLNLTRPAMRENSLRRQLSTPDSESTSSSDHLDNLFSAHLSQTLSQSSVDDRDKNDVALDSLRSPRGTPSDYGSNLYMPLGIW